MEKSCPLSPGLFVFVCSAALQVLYLRTKTKMKTKTKTNTPLQRSRSTERLPTSFEYDFFPPLPPQCVSLLSASRLCHLATQSEGVPHLSLMNFTYCKTEEVIILCTRKATLKFDQIKANPSVRTCMYFICIIASEITISPLAYYNHMYHKGGSLDP